MSQLTGRKQNGDKMNASFNIIYKYIIPFLTSMIITWAFFRISQEKKRIIKKKSSIHHTLPISDKYSGISVTFNDEVISDFYTTVITFRNAGNQLIVPSDIEADNKWSIDVLNGKFLIADPSKIDKWIIRSPNHSGFHLKLDENNNSIMNIQFDYFPVGSSFTVSINHTGELREKGTFSNKGDIKDQYYIDLKIVKYGFRSLILSSIVIVILYFVNIMILSGKYPIFDDFITSMFGYFLLLVYFSIFILMIPLAELKSMTSTDKGFIVFILAILKGDYDKKSDQ